MFSAINHRRAFWSLIVMRVFYALNWLNIGSIFAVMAQEFGAGVGGLGVLTSSFYLGIGLLQVPGGIYAAKYGPKNAVVVGTVVASASALLSGLVPSFQEVVALRFTVGAGMAFVFGPAIVLVAKYYQSGSEGLGVGLFNSAYDVGGFLALFSWGVVAADLGWRQSVVLSGGAGLATAALIAIFVPRDEKSAEFRIRYGQLKKIIFDKKLFLLSVGILSIGIGNGLVGSFMVYYLEKVYGLGVSLAGLIAGLIVLAPIFSAPLGGKLYDSVKKPRLLMLVSDISMAGCLVFVAYAGLPGAVICSLVGGVATGVGFTVGFAAARELNRAEREYEGLSVAWVNCVSLFGTFLPPLVFSYIADTLGYTEAWLSGAALTLILALALLLMEEGVALREG
jgi:ACS family glucarate transporter-like MFS transporter